VTALASVRCELFWDESTSSWLLEVQASCYKPRCVAQGDLSEVVIISVTSSACIVVLSTFQVSQNRHRFLTAPALHTHCLWPTTLKLHVLELVRVATSMRAFPANTFCERPPMGCWRRPRPLLLAPALSCFTHSETVSFSWKISRKSYPPRAL
jgi:hypothetical protein